MEGEETEVLWSAAESTSLRWSSPGWSEDITEQAQVGEELNPTTTTRCSQNAPITRYTRKIIDTLGEKVDQKMGMDMGTSMGMV